MTKRSPTARSYPVRVPRVAVGPLAPTVLGECSEWLVGLGYSPGSAAGVVNVLERLSWWMQLVGVEVDDIDEDLLARFVAVEGSRDRPCVAVKQWIGTMRRFLTAAGYLSATGVQPDSLTPTQAAVADWCSWMREQRGLTEKTIAARCRYAAGLLDVLMAADGSVQWWRLDASIINAYVAERGRPYGVVARAHIVGSVRCLLRWALSTGRLDRDLTAGILKPAGTRRSLPRGVDADQVAALLGVCNAGHRARGAGPGARHDPGAVWPACWRGRPSAARRHRLGKWISQGHRQGPRALIAAARSMWVRHWRRGCGCGRPRWTEPCSCGCGRRGR